MRHLTSEGLKCRGMASTSCPRSWVQYSKTRKMLHATLMLVHSKAATGAAQACKLNGCSSANVCSRELALAMPIRMPYRNQFTAC